MCFAWALRFRAPPSAMARCSNAAAENHFRKTDFSKHSSRAVVNSTAFSFGVGGLTWL